MFYLTQISIFHYQTVHVDKKKMIYLNMDENNIQFLPDGFTFDFQGKNEILIKTNNNKKKATTIVTTISSLDHFLPFFVIGETRSKNLQNKIDHKMSEKFNGKIYILKNKTHWMTQGIMKIYLQMVKNYKVPENTKLVLIMDKFRVHTMDFVKRFLEENNIAHFIIPGGLTSILQPLDVSIFKTFKGHIRYCYNNG